MPVSIMSRQYGVIDISFLDESDDDSRRMMHSNLSNAHLNKKQQDHIKSHDFSQRTSANTQPTLGNVFGEIISPSTRKSIVCDCHGSEECPTLFGNLNSPSKRTLKAPAQTSKMHNDLIKKDNMLPIGHISDEISLWKAKFTDISRKLTKERSIREGMAQSKLDLEREVNKLQTDLHNLIESSKAKHSVLQNDLRSATDRCNSYRTSLSDRENEVKSLREKLEDQKLNNINLVNPNQCTTCPATRARLRASEVKHQSVARKISGLEESNDALRSQVTLANAAIDSSRSQLIALRGEMDTELDRVREDCHQRLCKAQAEVSAVKAASQILVSELKLARGRLKEQSDELEHIRVKQESSSDRGVQAFEQEEEEDEEILQEEEKENATNYSIRSKLNTSRRSLIQGAPLLPPDSPENRTIIPFSSPHSKRRLSKDNICTGIVKNESEMDEKILPLPREGNVGSASLNFVDGKCLSPIRLNPVLLHNYNNNTHNLNEFNQEDDMMSVAYTIRSVGADAISCQAPLWLSDLKRANVRLESWIKDWGVDIAQLDSQINAVLGANVSAAAVTEREAGMKEIQETQKLLSLSNTATANGFILNDISGGGNILSGSSFKPASRSISSFASGGSTSKNGIVKHGSVSNSSIGSKPFCGGSVKNFRSLSSSASASSLSIAGTASNSVRSSSTASTAVSEANASAARFVVSMANLRLANARDEKKFAELKSGLALVALDGSRLAEMMKRMKQRELILSERETKVFEMMETVKNLNVISNAANRTLHANGSIAKASNLIHENINQRKILQDEGTEDDCNKSDGASESNELDILYNQLELSMEDANNSRTLLAEMELRLDLVSVESKKEITELNCQLGYLNVEIQKISDDRDHLQKLLDQTKTDDQEHSSLQGDLNDCQARIHVLSDHNENLEGRLHQLLVQQDALQQENELTKGENDILTDRIATLQIENENLVSQHTKLFQTHENSDSALNLILNEKNATLQSLTTELNATKLVLKEIENRQVMSQAAFEEKEEEHIGCLNELNEQLRQRKDHIESLQQTIIKNEEQLQIMNEKLCLLERQKTEYLTEKDRIHRALNENIDQKIQLQQLNDAHIVEINELKEVIFKSEAATRKLTADMEALTLTNRNQTELLTTQLQESSGLVSEYTTKLEKITSLFLTSKETNNEILDIKVKEANEFAERALIAEAAHEAAQEEIQGLHDQIETLILLTQNSTTENIPSQLDELSQRLNLLEASKISTEKTLSDVQAENLKIRHAYQETIALCCELRTTLNDEREEAQALQERIEELEEEIKMLNDELDNSDKTLEMSLASGMRPNSVLARNKELKREAHRKAEAERMEALESLWAQEAGVSEWMRKQSLQHRFNSGLVKPLIKNSLDGLEQEECATARRSSLVDSMVSSEIDVAVAEQHHLVVEELKGGEGASSLNVLKNPQVNQAEELNYLDKKGNEHEFELMEHSTAGNVLLQSEITVSYRKSVKFNQNPTKSSNQKEEIQQKDLPSLISPKRNRLNRLNIDNKAILELKNSSSPDHDVLVNNNDPNLQSKSGGSQIDGDEELFQLMTGDNDVVAE